MLFRRSVSNPRKTEAGKPRAVRQAGCLPQMRAGPGPLGAASGTIQSPVREQQRKITERQPRGCEPVRGFVAKDPGENREAVADLALTHPFFKIPRGEPESDGFRAIAPALSRDRSRSRTAAPDPSRGTSSRSFPTPRAPSGLIPAGESGPPWSPNEASRQPFPRRTGDVPTPFGRGSPRASRCPPTVRRDRASNRIAPAA